MSSAIVSHETFRELLSEDRKQPSQSSHLSFIWSCLKDLISWFSSPKKENPTKLITHFKVEVISINDTKKTLKVASAWAELSNREVSLAKDYPTKDQFSAFKAIAASIKAKEDTRPLYVCKNEFGHPQGMMVIHETEKNIHIDLLVSNPVNHPCYPFPDKSKQVRGAGTQLLEEAEKLARKQGKSVILDALPQARVFYEKHGYIEVNVLQGTMKKEFHEYATN